MKRNRNLPKLVVKGKKFTRPAIALKQKAVLDKLVENGGSVSKAIRDSGLYSENYAKNPQKLLASASWQELIETNLSDALLSKAHHELLMSTKLDHMVFPLGPEDEDDINFSGGVNQKDEQDEEVDEEGDGDRGREETKERTTLTDREIIEMLAEVNCKVRRIVHGESARHVYFWAQDNRSRKDALEMAYKLKGRYGNEGEGDKPTVKVYNFFDQRFQTNIKGYEDVLKKQILDAEKTKTIPKAVDPRD